MDNKKSLNNLKPFTKETASAAGKKGAKKTNQLRRERKALTQDLQAMLAMTVKDAKAKKILFDNFGITKGNYQQLMLAAQIVKAVSEKDTNAFKAIVEILNKQERKTQEEKITDVLDTMRVALTDEDDDE